MASDDIIVTRHRKKPVLNRVYIESFPWRVRRKRFRCIGFF
jgi:hypothetical protein